MTDFRWWEDTDLWCFPNSLKLIVTNKSGYEGVLQNKEANIMV